MESLKHIVPRLNGYISHNATIKLLELIDELRYPHQRILNLRFMVPRPNSGADKGHKIVRSIVNIYQKMPDKFNFAKRSPLPGVGNS